MPSTGAAKARSKSTPAAPPTVIKIKDGLPHKKMSYISLGGTVQFDNLDATDYRIRLQTKQEGKHPVMNVLLPAVGSVTLMADPNAKKKDATNYVLLPTNLQHPDGEAASAGGGKIVIGPTPKRIES
jgi:hypothetical protein